MLPALAPFDRPDGAVTHVVLFGYVFVLAGVLVDRNHVFVGELGEGAVFAEGSALLASLLGGERVV